MTPTPATLADEIEAELRAQGWWAAERPAPEAFESTTAFFGDTMAFQTWLQWVLLPRVRSGDLPTRSMVSAYAVRELDGVHEAGRLIGLLAALDDAVESGAS